MENNNSIKIWSIVHFIEDDSVEAVPSNWILNDFCYWPPWTRSKLTDAIKTLKPFNSCWPIYRIQRFRNATFDNYLSARMKAERACQTSDLNSDEGSKRRVVKRKIFDSTSGSEADEESILPVPPKISLRAKSMKSAGHVEQKRSSSLKERNLSSQLEVSEMTEPPQKSMPQKHCCCVEVKQMLGVLSNDISKKLTSLKANMLQIREDLNTVINNSENDSNIENFLLKFKFPFVTHETLQELELYLEDKDHLKQSIYQLSKLGGKDTYEFIKRCFVATISDTLAKEYTFDGTKTKRSFKGSIVSSLFIAAAESHNGSDKKNTETAIRKWLRRSAERNKYKQSSTSLNLIFDP